MTGVQTCALPICLDGSSLFPFSSSQVLVTFNPRVTVNDYLAKRDAEWMGKAYNFLGLSINCVIHGIKEEKKKAAYDTDITYNTNNEYGFDYLNAREKGY